MGGKALKHVHGIRRISSVAEYDALWQALRPLLSRYCDRAERVPHFREKKDFGDIDVLATYKQDGQMFDPTRDELIQSRGCVRNGEILSFEFRDVQVDIIPTRTELWDLMLFETAFDTAAILGPWMRKNGLKLTSTGFYARPRVSEESAAEKMDLLLTTSASDVTTFLGLPSRSNDAMISVHDMCTYLCTGTRYGDAPLQALAASILAPNHRKRVQSATRPYMSVIVEWLKVNRGISCIGGFGDDGCARNDALHYFGKTRQYDDMCARVSKKAELTRRAKACISGKDVAERTGLSGVELGRLIQAFREAMYREVMYREAMCRAPANASETDTDIEKDTVEDRAQSLIASMGRESVTEFIIRMLHEQRIGDAVVKTE